MRASRRKRRIGAPTQTGPHQSVSISLLDRAGVLMNAWVFLLIVAAVGRAEIIDRIAVVVGSRVITESEIVREIRLTAFLNQEPLDFSAASKRKVADRLVEQRLIQIENDASLYPPPPAEAVDQALGEVKARTKGYQAELTRAGVSEEEVRAHL